MVLVGAVRRDYIFRGGRYSIVLTAAALMAVLVATPTNEASDSTCREASQLLTPWAGASVAVPEGRPAGCACTGGEQPAVRSATLLTSRGEPPVGGTSTSPLPSEPETMPLYVSPAPDSGTYLESFQVRKDAGWATGLYMYWPGDMEWTSDWDRFVTENWQGIPVVGSPKRVDPASVHGFFSCLPQAWRDQWIAAYYQEPEDDFTTTEERAVFRERVSDMADMVRPYGVRNAVHLQEWTINPNNSKPWAGAENLSQFINVDDIDYLSWSLYPAEGESMTAGVDRIRSFSEKYAPGIPWGITAAGSPVNGNAPLGGPARELRAKIVEDAARYVAEVGGVGFGWFDFEEYRPGRDQLVSKDPALREAMSTAADVALVAP